jgi:uncharacterized protein
MKNTEPVISLLKKWFDHHPNVLVALSGGVDSCLVAYMARQLLGKDHAISVISNSASLKEKDLSDAQHFCEQYDIKLIEIDANEISDVNYSSNPVNRCYYCKSKLYTSILQLIERDYPGFEIINGNNFSDLGDYRPGIEAANENKILSPLADCNIDKETIRAISKQYNLSVWNKPASPCLSSRFPYGESITKHKLKMVEMAENMLNTKGFEDVRVRYKAGNASIEVPANQIRKLKLISPEVNNKLSTYGFKQVNIDDEGLISGKLNRDIKKNK